MRISRTRHLKVNMGTYESYEFGATVTLDWDDIDLADREELADAPLAERTALLTGYVVQTLDAQLVQEIEDSVELTDEEKSFVLLLAQPNKEPARRPRKKR